MSSKVVTIGAIIPIVLLVQSGFKLVGLILSSPGLISPPNMVFSLLFTIFGLFMCSLVAIRFAVDVIGVEEVEEVAVFISTLGLGAEWGDVE